MSLILGSERLLYNRVIVEAELNVDDFEITLERDSPEVERTDSLGDAGTGTIKVIYKPTGLTTHYRYGVVPPPWSQFDLDLKGNLFKTH